MAEKEKWYRLTRGKHHHREVDEKTGKVEALVLREGDEVMLTDEQYEANKDRFVPIDKKGGKEVDPNPPLTPTQPQQNLETSAENADKVPAASDTTQKDKDAAKALESKPSDGKTGAGATASTPAANTKTVP